MRPMARISAQQDTNGALQSLGRCIVARRNATQLSQEALAQLAGIDRSHMGRIERGERNVTLLNLLRIAKALKVSASTLLDEANL